MKLSTSFIAAAAMLGATQAAYAQTEIQFWHAFTGRLGELVAEQVEYQGGEGLEDPLVGLTAVGVLDPGEARHVEHHHTESAAVAELLGDPRQLSTESGDTLPTVLRVPDRVVHVG